MIGLYVARNSVIHQAPPWLKLLTLAALVTALAFHPTPTVLLVAGIALVVVHFTAKLSLRHLWSALRPLLIVGVIIAAFQLWVHTWQQAVSVVGQLLIAAVAANIVLLTTRISDMMSLVGKVFGFRVELLLSLTIRSIPTVAATAQQAQQACWARGLRARLVWVLPALIVRIIRDADLVGDAIAARDL